MRRWMGITALGVALFMPEAGRAQDKACTPTVVGHLDILPLASRIFHNQRSLRVWLPPGYDDPANAQKKYKVLYVLDGQNVFDACTAYANDEMRADETLTELITTGKMQPVIVVGVDNGVPAGGTNYGGIERAREFLPYADPTNPDVPARDLAGNDFPEFLQTEVMPPIAAKYRILAGAENTGVAGSSYGGLAAAYALIRRPDLFGLGIVESPSLEVGNGQLLRDSVSLVLGPRRVAFGVGTAEVEGVPGADAINAMEVRGVTALAENFKSIAVAPPQVLLTIREGAKHATKYFGERLAAALIFLYGPEPAK